MQTLKKVASIALSVVMWIIILVAALYAFTTLATRDNDNVANIAGFTPLSVQSNSMSPTFDQGDLIVIQQCDPSKLNVGDIVTFHTIINNEYTLNTHRIEKIDEAGNARSFTTKGDNNEFSDQHVIAGGDIVGKYVLRIPYLGNVFDFLSTSVGFLCVIVLPMLIFFVYQVYHLIIVGMNLKRATLEEERMARAQAILDAEALRAAAAGADADAAGAGATGESSRAAAASSANATEEKTGKPSENQ